MEEIGVLIFSKNRACQLDLCLRSHKRFWGEKIRVLYTCDKEFEAGYKKLMKKHPDVEFIRETNFKRQVLDSLDHPYTTFFCDDDVMIRKFNPKCREFRRFKQDRSILCLSMRLDYRYDFHFETGQTVRIPDMDQGKWLWGLYHLDWGYPMSVLGHIFRTNELIELVTDLDFNSPNTFEGRMAERPLNLPYVIGFKRAKNINLPMNMVNRDAQSNKAGDVSVIDLEKKFLDGYEIDLDQVIKDTKKARSAFIFVEYKFKEEA